MHNHTRKRGIILVAALARGLIGSSMGLKPVIPTNAAKSILGNQTATNSANNPVSYIQPKNQAIDPRTLTATEAGVGAVSSKTRQASAANKESFLDKAEGATGKIFMGDMVSMVVPTVFGAVGAGFNFIGKAPFGIGLPFKMVGGAFKGVGGAVGEARKVMGEKTVRDLPAQLAKGVRKTSGYMFDAGEGLNPELDGLVAKAEELQKTTMPKIGEKVQKPFTAAGGAIDRAFSGVLKPFVGWKESVANKRLEPAKNALSKLEESIAKNAGHFEGGAGAEYLSELQKYAADLRGHVDGKAALSKNALGDAAEGIGRTLKEMTGLTGLSSKADSAVSSISKSMKGDRFFNRGFAKHFSRLGKAAGSLEFFKAPGIAISKIPANIANSKIHHAGFSTLFGAGMVFSGGHLINNISGQFKQLKALTANLEGTKDASAFHVLFSNDVSPVVKQARGQFWQVFGTKAITELVADAFTIKVMGKGASGLAFMGMMAPHMVGGFLEPKNQLLPIRGAMKEGMAAGQQPTADAYAMLLSSASADVRKAGGAENGLTISVAHEYAELQMSPDDVLQEVSNGKMVDRAKVIQDKMEANGRKAGAIDPDVAVHRKAEIEANNRAYGIKNEEVAKVAPSVDKPTMKIAGKDSAETQPMIEAGLPDVAMA